MNQFDLLNNWVVNKFVTRKKDKWDWTRNTKKLIPARVRNTLMSIISGTPCPGYMVGQLKRYGFDSKGVYRAEEKSSGSTKV